MEVDRFDGRYTDDEGRTHNCIKGQCSPIYKDVYEHKQEVEKQCHQFKGQPLQEVSAEISSKNNEVSSCFIV